MTSSEDITQEVNFYNKDICKLNEHYRLHPVSDYMSGDVPVAHLMPDWPYAYICLNEPNSFTKLIREHEAHDIMVGEGLVKTYPVKKALDVFKKFCRENLPDELCDLKLSDTELVKTPGHDIKVIDSADDEFDDNEVASRIWLRFPFYDKDDLSSFIKKLNDTMFVCGYSYASTNRYYVAVQPFADKLTLVVLMFEAKYFEEEFSWSENLYHVTTLDKLAKVKRHGLVPMSKSSRFDYPDRVYLFNNATRDVMFNYICQKAESVGVSEVAVMKIRSDKLRENSSFKSGKMKFFIDHMFEDGLSAKANALFTYDVISPSLIEDDVLIIEVDGYTLKSTRSEKFR